jgi:hypothetical protein
LLFISKGGKGSRERSSWIEGIGEWRYYCDVLSGFDPIKSNEMYMESTHDELARAWVSSQAYNYIPNE